MLDDQDQDLLGDQVEVGRAPTCGSESVDVLELTKNMRPQG